MSQSLTLFLPGAVGRLEACLTQPTGNPETASDGLAILCHPHPQFGGSMHDAVLATIERVLVSAGWACLRFNFRGVGGSDGTFDQGIGEQQDLQSVLASRHTAAALADALRPAQRTGPMLLCGYSFGAAMAWKVQLAARHQLHGLWLIAPPLAALPLAASSPNCPLQVMVGDQDVYCPVTAARDWLQAMSFAHALQLIPGADHFFSGKQDLLAAQAQKLLR